MEIEYPDPLPCCYVSKSFILCFTEDYQKIFSGNIDDHFRIGVSVAKKTLKLYSKFYGSDIIIASPLGLRTIIGAEGSVLLAHHVDKFRTVLYYSNTVCYSAKPRDCFLVALTPPPSF